ncbi:hypothetical protein ACFQU7_14720 [Pseudoroseomonas wenyumeiae]
MAAEDAKNAGATLKDEAQRVASEVASQGAKVAEDVKSVGQELGSAAADKAEALAEQGKQAGVERGIGLADATRRVADDLEGTSPRLPAMSAPLPIPSRMSRIPCASAVLAT